MARFDRTSMGRFVEWADWLMVSIWLIVFYWFTISFVVIVLAAQQFHLKVEANIAREGEKGLPLGELVVRQAQHAQLREQLVSYRQKQTRLEESARKLEEEQFEARSVSESLFRQAVRIENEYVNRVRTLVGTKESFPRADDRTELGIVSDIAFREMLAAAQSNPNLKILPVPEQLEILISENQKKYQEWSDKKRLLESNTAEQTRLVENITKTEVKLAELTISPKTENQSTPVASNVALLYELDSFLSLEVLWFKLINPIKLVGLPTSVLTLLLALSMGALGSAIYVTAEFFGASERTAGWYLFRPFLGMITALAVYIAFKAGQISLSGTGAANDSTLNPFIVSFFAVISGLLSEQAILRLSAVGKGWLDDLGSKESPAPLNQVPPLRFAKSWSNMFSENRTKEALAQALSVDVSQIERWQSGSEPIPEAFVDPISAFFGVPAEEVFELRKP